MKKRIFRVTRSPHLFNELVGRTKHLITKRSDGSYFCEVHQCPANSCSAQQKSAIVWSSSIDSGTYSISVKRISPYNGTLTLERGGKRIFECNVAIAYDAPFGADTEDILEWRRIGINEADADYKKRGESPPH